MFDAAFVINLPHRIDRLTVFKSIVPKCFGEIIVWPAVQGDVIPHPDWWRAGSGAWGCCRSHMQILEHCYQKGYRNYIVFEDDAIFVDNFEERLQQFMQDVPAEWEQIYLGGQLYHADTYPPKRITPNVYQPYNVNRTQCFAVSKTGYPKLYKHLNQEFVDEEHIDHHLGRLHESGELAVYCPAKWLVGQDGGNSDISGRLNSVMSWENPEVYAKDDSAWAKRFIPAIHLECSLEVALAVERKGWHRGKWLSPERLDKGVCEALGSLKLAERLEVWYKAVYLEALREGKSCVCLYHPNLHKETVKKFTFAEFKYIKADTVESAEEQFIEISKASPTFKFLRTTCRSNLIYYIYPRKSELNVWRWNVDELLKHIEQFDGKRIIAVALGPETATLEDVQAAFKNHHVNLWLPVDHNPTLGEVSAFEKMLRALPQDESNTFYAHAKGVTYDDPVKAELAKDWAYMMYESCLSDVNLIQTSLGLSPITGPFYCTQHWKDGTPLHDWHYSGTFFWFRTEELSRPNIFNIVQDRWGVEKWPGNNFTREESGKLFGQNVAWLYNTEELQRMKDLFKTWKNLNRNTQPFLTQANDKTC